MKVTVLGSGTSTGVPEYRCSCQTCEDARKPGSRNARTRPSIFVEVDEIGLQVDTGPNFLDQIDRHGVERIDAVLYTHCHADHISGTNDLVMPCRKQEMDMPIYGSAETMVVLQKNFDYMFSCDTFQGGGVAHLEPHVVEGEFEVQGVPIRALPVEHGAVNTVGYRIGALGYVPDVKRMPEDTVQALVGVEVLILDALSFNPRHPTHFCVAEAVEIAQRVGARRTFLTHIMHRLDARFFEDQCRENGVCLPKEVELAYDGLVVEV
ncbi:MAG: MBL fold metallo-hydrolase [bacterium]|nr:MBL fold metallo-hydrolase [bacterium]